VVYIRALMAGKAYRETVVVFAMLVDYSMQLWLKRGQKYLRS